MEETVELDPGYIKKINVALEDDLANQKLAATFSV